LTWGETPTSDDKTMALLSHLSVYVFPFLGPIIFYLIFQEKSRFIKYHAVQALLSHAALWGMEIIGIILITIISTITCGIGSVLYIVLLPLPLLHLWGAYKAYQGEWEGYPLVSGIGRG
jgi:hypothetical protein